MKLGHPIPMISGDEVDALDRDCKGWYHWSAGARKRIKQGYNRRVRRLGRLSLTGYQQATTTRRW